MFSNILKPLKNISFLLIFVTLVVLDFMIWWEFTDIVTMFGNYGNIHTYMDITLSVMMIVGFPLFIIGILYRWSYFGHRENLHHKTGIGIISGFIGTILSGCSCCGITLASYFGLLPMMSLLPYSGLEIKVLWTIGLLWAIGDTYRNLETCQVKNDR